MRFIIILTTVLCAAAFWSSAALAWVSVGSSPGFGSCDYTTIDEALDDGDTEIRVLDNQDFVENLLIQDSVTIRGGFTSCLAASLNDPQGGNTVIDGSDSGIFATISIIGLSPIDVTLENVQITGGVGGVFTSAVGELHILDSTISANTGNNGGGLVVDNSANGGQPMRVFLRDSAILGNSADNGGGIHCSGDNAIVIIAEDSAVLENTATQNGGGVYVSNSCSVGNYAGSHSGQLLGVINNQALQNGGGAYVESDASFYVLGEENPIFPAGNNTQPGSLSGNTATLDGGGVYATGAGSEVIFRDAMVDNNTAGDDGGAVALYDTAQLQSVVSDADCWGGYRCTVFTENNSGEAGYGGHIYMEGGSSAFIAQTHFDGGRSDLGTAIYIRDQDSNVYMEGSLIYAMGALLHVDYDDEYVIRIFNGADVELKHVTIANNLITTAAIGVDGGTSSLSIENSIVHQAVDVVNEVASPITSYYCMAVNEATSVSGSLVNVTTPEFADPGNNDYRITEDFGGIDVCADSGMINPDIDHQEWGYDSPMYVNIDGPFDIGADEFDDSDVVFKDGFGD